MTGSSELIEPTDQQLSGIVGRKRALAPPHIDEGDPLGWGNPVRDGDRENLLRPLGFGFLARARPRRRTVRFFFYRWRWRSIPIGYAFALLRCNVFSALLVPALAGVFAVSLAFLDNVTPFFAETGVENPVAIRGPELKNCVLDLGPSPHRKPDHARQLFVVIGKAAILEPPRRHEHQQVGTMLLGREVHSVRQVGIGKEGDRGWLAAHVNASQTRPDGPSTSTVRRCRSNRFCRSGPGRRRGGCRPGWR